MKVILYINAIHQGGAERVMVNLAESFAASGAETILVTSFIDQWEYPLSSAVHRISLEETELKQGKLKRNISRVLKLRRILNREKPDVLISFMAEPNYRALIAAKGLPVKTIISVRSDPNKEYAGKAGRFLGQYLLPSASGCVFQTEDAKSWFPAKLQAKSTIIFNPVKEDFYRIERTPVPGKIMTFGRIEAVKNHRLLIDAFSLISKQYPHAELFIYGEGSQMVQLQAYIDDLHLTDRVHLPGQSSNVAALLQEAEMFVLSSDYEGMPNALMEALAAGVPCVSTDCPCGGPRALIEHKKNGLLVPVGDAKRLADAMKKILSDSLYAQEMGEQARADADRYHPDHIFDQWMKYVQHIQTK